MKNETEEVNAVIESVSINDGDRGLLTAWVQLDYGGSGQGFGGYALYLPSSYRHSSAKVNYAGVFIWRVMEVGGVSRWEDLPGKTVRVRRSNGLVKAIGHIVKDVWFDPQAEFEAIQDEE